VTSLTAATLYGGEGNDLLLKTDLRTQSQNPMAEGQVSAPAFSPRPDGLSQDPAWVDFDIFDGGAGNDTISAGNGPDWAYGGDGDDTFYLGAGNNVLFAGAGDDVVFSSGVFLNSVVGSGGSYSATNFASPSSNAYSMGDGDDVVTIRFVDAGAELVAAVNGEAGDDTVRVSSMSASWLTGGDGNDLLQTTNDRRQYNITTERSCASRGYALWRGR
jgi:Ca2+-binding RTX toxin-like protein